MGHSTSVSQFRSEYDDFLYASIDESSDGTLLSVLSALARLDIDLWQEAANLARMSHEKAIHRLAALPPGGPFADRNCETIAARLIALLGRRTSLQTAPGGTFLAARPMSPFRGLIYFIVINAVFMVFTFGSHYFKAVQQPSLQVGHAQAPAASTAGPKVPPPSFGR